MKRAAGLVCLAILVSLGNGSASAQILKYRFDMSGDQEADPNASTGIGVGSVTIDTETSTMRVKARFSDLISNSTNAHIHCCTIPTAGVATATPTFPGFPSGVTAGTYDNTFDMTAAGSWNAAFIGANGGTPESAFNALLLGLESGVAYFNIHSTMFGGGEIRGFAVLVPEPASAVLALVGLGMPIVLRRSR